MDKLAEDFASQDVGALFLYVNEAHPGELYPHHRSMEQKLSHARAMVEVYGLRRPLYIDALDGACHRHFGSMPNMSWIFNRAGRPVYKADWTDAGSVRNAVEFYLAVLARRGGGENMTPFNVFRVDYRGRNRAQFFENLARAGPQAVSDFENAFGPQWATEKAEDHNPPPD